MLYTILISCHNKEKYTPAAIASVLSQTYQNWEGIVFDSGVLYDQGYYDQFDWFKDSRLKLIRSNETEEMRQQKNMASWVYNECFRRNLVNGDLVSYLCDDDLLYSNAFDVFVSASQSSPDALAFYASQDYGWVRSDGAQGIFGERRALSMAGRCCNGVPLCCRVDYLQFCHKKEIVTERGIEWPEGAERRGDADGVFMERVGDITPIYPIDIKVSLNRRSPQSIISPTS